MCDMFMVVVVVEGRVHQFYCQGEKGLDRQDGWHVVKQTSRKSVEPVSLRNLRLGFHFI